MENPYEVPRSALENNVLTMRKKAGWKIFFWLYFCFELLGITSMFFGEDDTVFDIVGEVVVYSFVLLGLFAFAYNKKIAAPLLWKTVLFVLVGWDCYVLIEVFIDDTYAGVEVAVIVGLSIFVLAILFLQYFALYQYAFQSKEIWSKS